MGAKLKPIIRKVVFLNALSPSMLSKGGVMVVTPIDAENAKQLIGMAEKVESYVGHQGMAALLSHLLNMEVQYNRAQFVADGLTLGIVAIIAERLPEGRVLTKEEVEALYSQGKVKLYAVIFDPSL